MSSVSIQTSGTSAVPASAAKRMSSDERRESILEAAIAVFGAKGYEGATTDEVARAAGVSQPYVVRLFGTKEKLFLAASRSVVDRLLAEFRLALDDDSPLPEFEKNGPLDPHHAHAKRMGLAFVNLLKVRGLHLTLQNCFMLGAHPVIGPHSRALFAEVWRFAREEAGFTAEEAHGFLSQGMLITTLIGLRVVDDYGDDASIAELLKMCFPETLEETIGMLPKGDEPW
jgi:AcrR family transcriptional regulator